VSAWVAALAGGALIGLASGALMLGLGRIAGISGIFGGVVGPLRIESAWQVAFVAGLAVAGVLGLLSGLFTTPERATSLPLVIAAGLLVGAGTTLGSGCTSGHGVCGLARLSVRSVVAVVVFLATGIVTTLLVRHWS
jgi:uncharacterized membrane protein YedE/YeeE